MPSTYTLNISNLPADWDPRRHGDVHFGRIAREVDCNIHFGQCSQHFDSQLENNVAHRSVTLTVGGNNPKKFIKRLERLEVGTDTEFRTVRVDEDFLGLIRLAETPSPDCSVIFVHGLGGHAFDSWASPAIGSDPWTVNAWPRDFLPQAFEKNLLRATFDTLGYNADIFDNADPSQSLRAEALDLIDRLLAARPRGSAAAQRPMFFVCHSLGGLVLYNLCKALTLILSDDTTSPRIAEQHRELFVRPGLRECLVKGIVFLGTPFNGSLKANQILPFIKLLAKFNPRPMNTNLLQSLRKDATGGLSELCNRANVVIAGNDIKVLIGLETQPVSGTGRTQITERESAIGVFGNSTVPMVINKDHVNMIKFAHRTDADYVRLESRIIAMVKEKMQRRATTGGTHLPHASTSDPSRPSDAAADPGIGLVRTATMPVGSSTDVLSQNLTHVHLTVNMPGESSHRVTDDSSSRPSSYRSMQDYGFTPGHLRPQYTASPQSSPPLGTKHPIVPAAHADRHPGTPPASPPQKVAAIPTPTALLKRSDNSKLASLGRVDTVLIIDNTPSMQVAADETPGAMTRWALLQESVRHVVDLAVQWDSDGIDVFFLNPLNPLGSRGATPECMDELGIDDATKAAGLMSKLAVIERLLEHYGGGTYFFPSLEKAIEPKLSAFRRYHESRNFSGSDQGPQPIPRPKGLNVIFITDGQAHDHNDVVDYVMEVAEKLNNWGAPKTWLGIEFVQIGQDEEAALWLRELDDELKLDPRVRQRDMIDTTPYNSRNHSGMSQEMFANLLTKIMLAANDPRQDRIGNETFAVEADDDSIPASELDGR